MPNIPGIPGFVSPGFGFPSPLLRWEQAVNNLEGNESPFWIYVGFLKYGFRYSDSVSARGAHTDTG